MHGVGQSQSSDSFFSPGHQRSSLENMICEGLQHTDVLFVAAVCLDLQMLHIRLLETFLFRAAKLSLIDTQLIKEQFSVLTDDLAHLKGQFQTIGTGSVAGSGDKHAGCAVLILQIGGHIILHFNIVPLRLMTEGTYLRRHPAQPLQQIQLMRALIQQHAAAFSVPCSLPARRIIIALGAIPVSHDPIHTLQRSKLTAFNHLMELSVDTIGSLVQHQRIHLITLCRDLIDLSHLLRIYAGRLFTDHVYSMGQTIAGELRMKIMRCSDQDRVADTGVDHFLSVVKNLHLLRQCLSGPVQPALSDIRYSCQHHGRYFALRNTHCVSASHSADSDNTQSHLFHCPISFSENCVFSLFPIVSEPQIE